jgi:arginine decarboxylase
VFGEVVPIKLFLTKGVGVHREKAASYQLALRAAGVAHCNLVLVSSIYPPGCKIIPKDEGLKLLRPGDIVFAVYDRQSTNEPNRLIAASVGLAVPAEPSMHGYLSEHHSFGETDERAGDYAEDLAASMLATTLGIEFNPESDWDEREQLFKQAGKIVRTSNITQSAVGNKDGLWTSVFAAAMLIGEDNLAAEIEKTLMAIGNNGSAAEEAPTPAANYDQREVARALQQAAREPNAAATRRTGLAASERDPAKAPQAKPAKQH